MFSFAMLEERVNDALRFRRPTKQSFVLYLSPEDMSTFIEQVHELTPQAYGRIYGFRRITRLIEATRCV